MCVVHQVAKQIVMAGFKCPPDVGAAMIIANIIPTANARPIWKKLPNTAAPSGFVALVRSEATDAMPGKT